MFRKTQENFTTRDTTVDDVAPQEDKNIMLTDAAGNISLVKFNDTVIKLQDMIKALNDTVISQKAEIDELTRVQATKLTQPEVDARVIKGFSKLTWSRSQSTPKGGRNIVGGVGGATSDVFRDRGGKFLFLYKPTDLS
jgi:hypothetical protein